MIVIDLIARIREVTALLAIRSLTPLEPPFESSDAMRVLADGKDDSRRCLYIGDSHEPVVTATTNGDVVNWRIADEQRLPEDLRFALAAIGSKGQGGDLDIEEFDDRVCSVDQAWCLMRRLRITGAEPVAAHAATLMAYGAAWERNRGLLFEAETERSTLIKERGRLEAQARDMVLQNPTWLRAIRLHPDPRGSALSIEFIGREHDFYLSGSSLAWAVDIRFALGATSDVPRVGTGRYAVRPTRVDERVVGALAGAMIEGHDVRLVKQLPPALYKKVSALLQEMGAAWVTSKQAHVFAQPASEVLNALIATGYAFTRKDYEFFETQPLEVHRVMTLAGIEPGMDVLEPSAGRGAMALMAAEIVGKEHVQCYELMPQNAAELRALGFRVEEADFLSVEPSAVYHRLVLNPPFSGGRDIAHVQHALKFVRPGGRLVAITSVVSCRGETKPQRAFQTLLRSFGAEIFDIEAGAFAEAGTDVPTCLVVIDVPEKVAEPSPPPRSSKDGEVSSRQRTPGARDAVAEQAAFDFA